MSCSASVEPQDVVQGMPSAAPATATPGRRAAGSATSADGTPAEAHVDAEGDPLQRAGYVLGQAALERLAAARVAVVGVGGVGSWCAECLVRTGVGHLTLVDPDLVALSNCNRQLMATPAEVGRVKVDVLAERLRAVRPGVDVRPLAMAYTAATAEALALERYDCVVDAIDSVADKAHLILRLTGADTGVMLVSSMGAALRTDPLRVRTAEFWRVTGDGLARALRSRFRRERTFPARRFTCVYSDQPPVVRRVAGLPVGSLCQVTAVFGMTLASLVVGRLTAE